MGKILYILFIKLYPLVAAIISPFNDKAKLWRKGRKNIFELMKQKLKNDTGKKVWIHCASLGEFEQGRPLIEALGRLYPRYKILLTFFSPSGYEIQKSFSGADYIFYLPSDGVQHAKLFYDITEPELILFIKYEFWYYYLNEAKQRHVPLLLVSGNFREGQPFFQWYGNFHRAMLQCFTQLFVQNEMAAALLETISIKNVSVSGDTRFDRVLQVADNFQHITPIKDFCAGRIVIVAGSTWLEDDEELDHYVNTHPDMRFIVAPHDIGKERLEECRVLYKQSLLYSEFLQTKTKNSAQETVNTLIIDNIGMLKTLYEYATICYVGGGFGGDGVHNVLEPAVYGKPVIFGPVYDKYIEAIELADCGGAFPVENAVELEVQFSELLNDKQMYEKACSNAGNYVRRHAGATQQIMQFIQEKRLLTN